MDAESVVPVLVKHVDQSLCLVHVKAQLLGEDWVGLVRCDVTTSLVVIPPEPAADWGESIREGKKGLNLKQRNMKLSIKIVTGVKFGQRLRWPELGRPRCP